MIQHTISINNCKTDPEEPHVSVCDQVRFCSGDRAYRVTGLGNVLRDEHGHIDVPAGGCSDYYIVIGTRAPHGYNIGPNCPRKGKGKGPPVIIIDN